MRDRKPFLVGWRTRRGTTMILVQRPAVPMLGPWSLWAVVSAN